MCAWGDAAYAAYALYPGTHRSAEGGALGGPGTVKGDEVQVFAGKIHHAGGNAPQRDRGAAGVFHHGGTGDEVTIRKDGVAQRHRKALEVLQRYTQRLAAGVKGRQPGQHILRGANLRPRKAPRRRAGPVGPFRGEKGRVVVAQAGGRVFLRQQVGPAAGVVVGRGNGARRIGAFAVVQMKQAAVGIGSHLVGGVGGVQGIPPLGVATNNHGASLL